MARVTVTAAVVLTLLTGLVLGQIGLLAGRSAPGLAQPNPSPRALATARAFYDGMNRLLASGDRSIETTVAPGFVEHTADGQGDRTLPEMVDWLLAMPASWPDLRIDVLDLEQRDRLIAVRLEVTPNAPAPIAALPLTTPAPRQVLELLRVEGAAVTERWNAAEQLPVAALSLNAALDWRPSSLVTPAITRLSLTPGQSLRLPLDPTVILQVESGRVQLDRAGTDPDGTERFAREPLDAGRTRIFAGEGVLTLRSIAAGPSELWVLSTNGTPAHRAASGDAMPAPAHEQTIAFMPLDVSTDQLGRHDISIARISLPPGTTVPIHTPGVIEAIAVLDGALDVTVDRGRALLCTDGKTAHPFDDTVTITAGQGMSANDIASLGYRVAGPQPATLLIMRIDSSPPGNIPN